MNENNLKSTNVANRLERLPVCKLHYKLLVIHGFGWLFDAMDVFIIAFVMVPLAKDWKLSSAQLGLIASSGMIGMLIGAIVSGIVADYWGRKSVFQVTLLIFALASLLCAGAVDIWSMVVFRFLVGVGLGGELPVVASLFSEFVPGKNRGWFMVMLESFWAGGSIVAAIVAYFIIPVYGWRIAFVIGAIPAFYIWVVRRKLPESPRWLESKGRFDEAERVMNLLEGETERLTGRSLPPAGQDPAKTESIAPMRFSFLELWIPTYRTRTIMLWILWFGLVFGYYGIFIWLPSLLVKDGYTVLKSFAFVLGITLAQLPGYFSAAYLVDRAGRKLVITSYLLLSAVAAYLLGHASNTMMMVVWASLMSFFNLGAWGAVYTYTPELYPTHSRATGVGAAGAIGRIGGIIAPIIVGILLPTVGRNGVLTMNAAMFAIGAVAVSILGMETKGQKTIEETSR